jgi:hypothetical protein
MLITTTHSVEGKRIRKYFGVVAGEAVLRANMFKDMFAGIRDLVGGRSGTYVVCSEANARPRPESGSRRHGENHRSSAYRLDQDRVPSRNTLAETLRRRVRIRIFGSDPLYPSSASQRLCERSFFFLGDRSRDWLA